MTKFRKLVENILQQEVGNKFIQYINEINETGEVSIKDKNERNAFHDYCYEHDEELPFDPDELRNEEDLIYLA